MQPFNRIEDPVIDQDNAKLLGGVGGGYAAWKQHANSIKNRKGLIDRTIGRVGSLGTRPVRTLVGAGLGALGAGLGARVINKENKESHQEDMMRAAMQPQQQYQMPQYGMQRFAAEKKSGIEFDMPSVSSGASQMIQGGGLGALASLILGKKLRTGAGLGAMGNVAYNAMSGKNKEEDTAAANKKDNMNVNIHNYQSHAFPKSQMEANSMHDASSMERYASEKELEKTAFLKYLAKKALSLGAKPANSKKLMTGGTSLKQELMNNAPGVNRIGNTLKGIKKPQALRMSMAN